jgi:hypothetical protein
MVEMSADLLLYPAFVGTNALLLMYGLLQPWWRTWFGISFILILATMTQMLFRAMLTLWFGMDYPGRSVILLVGRAEVLLAVWIAVIALGRDLRRAWKGPLQPGQRSHGFSEGPVGTPGR